MEINGLTNNLMGGKIIFMHIPKTAGTSFKNSLINHFDDNYIFPSKKLMRKYGGRYPDSWDFLKYKGSLEKSKLIYGHYPNHLLNKINNEGYIKITFVRDPIKRTISHLKHLKLYNEKFCSMTLEEIFRHESLNINQFDNLQTRYFLNGAPNKKLNYNNLKIAKKNLKSFTFIGVTEYYQQSLEILNERLELKLEEIKVNTFDENYNSKSVKLDFKIDEDLFFEIYESNRFDIELYNVILSDLKPS